ncbi:MAG: hypothetical protein CMM52_09265 [Rhodospirillaceae bacterium]|nr:hypothetical protein [Rhodospirillaceae bacterium]|tara:strand:- start:1998 stop:2390 length:393 start_codon:yes stop_codon:yes gene_type:complete
MTTALATNQTDTNSRPNPTNSAEVVGFPGAGDRDPQAISQDIIENAMSGVEKLLKMPPDELRDVIAQRVELLDSELKERETRRKAIDEALTAQRILKAKGERARDIRHKVNVGSSVAAAMFTGIVIVSMF